MQRLLTLLAHVRPVLVRYAYQKSWHVHRSFFRELKPFLQQMSESEQTILYKRISKYILNIHYIFGWFGVLRGKHLTRSERKVALYLSGFIPMYDDYNDDDGLNHEQIMTLLAKEREECTPKEQLFVYFYKQAIAHYADSDLFWKYLEKAGESQDESLQQFESTLRTEEIFDITTKKGGYSLLFLRGAMAQKMQKEESEAVFLLGQLIQLMDDIFDMHKDAMASISTLPTSTDDIKSLRHLFYSIYEQTLSRFNQLEYALIHRKKFEKYLRFFIAPTFVCLDQFAELQDKNDGKFDVKKYARKALICDMEHPANIWRSLRYYWKGFHRKSN